MEGERYRSGVFSVLAQLYHFIFLFRMNLQTRHVTYQATQNAARIAGAQTPQFLNQLNQKH